MRRATRNRNPPRSLPAHRPPCRRLAASPAARGSCSVTAALGLGAKRVGQDWPPWPDGFTKYRRHCQPVLQFTPKSMIPSDPDYRAGAIEISTGFQRRQFLACCKPCCGLGLTVATTLERTDCAAQAGMSVSPRRPEDRSPVDQIPIGTFVFKGSS